MLKEWIWLATRRGIKPNAICEILEYFGTPERVYYAPSHLYEELPVLSSHMRESLCDKSMEQVEQILEACERLNLRVMTYGDGDYPQRLRELADPPIVLYILGRTIQFDQEPVIGVVGTRTPSQYGQRVATQLGYGISKSGGLLVSGMAQGIDAAALKGALQSGRPVVSILAGGVDLPYPRQNIGLYHDVAAVGAVISERPPGTPHLGEYFPIRNRIISGLSLGVVAVECRRHSGTMRTIEHALEQNRDVFAVPGNIDSQNSEGPNWLLRQGARPITGYEDILEEYWSYFPQKLQTMSPMNQQVLQKRIEAVLEKQEKPQNIQPSEPKPEPQEQKTLPDEESLGLTEQERHVLAIIREKKRACEPDELVEWAQIPVRQILSILSVPQIYGLIEEQPGKRFKAQS